MCFFRLNEKKNRGEKINVDKVSDIYKNMGMSVFYTPKYKKDPNIINKCVNNIVKSSKLKEMDFGK